MTREAVSVRAIAPAYPHVMPRPGDRHTSGVRPGGCALRVTGGVERVGKLALGDRESADRHVEFVGDLLCGQRASGPDESADASQGDHRARGPRLGRAVSNHAEAGGVSQHLPDGLRVRPPEAAPAPGGGEARGMLAGGALVGLEPGLSAHRLEYRPAGREAWA